MAPKIDTETIFKPRYSGRSAFALYLWPISAIAFVFFTVDTFRSASFYAEGLMAIIFALATFSPPFVYFRAIRFGEELTVKRWFLPDVVIQYNDITSFQYFSLRTAQKRISLSNLTPKSFEELDQIISRLAAKGKIKIKTKR